jgi:ABC-2 type transport system ATP-binding protein
VKNFAMKPPRNVPAAVDVENVHMCFFGSGVTRALQDVTFRIGRGAVFGLFGPQGSGKSTTLRLLAGHIVPTDGKIRVLGRRPRRRTLGARVAHLPQAGDREPAKGFQRLIRMAGRLFSPFKTVPAVVPGGPATAQQSTVRFVKMLLGDPEVLLLDQPFAGLDAEACLTLKSLIRSLASRGKTIVLASNDFSDAPGLCDRVALYWRGRIEAIGTPAEMMGSRHTVGFVAALLPPGIQDALLDVIREKLPGQIAVATAKPAEIADDLLQSLTKSAGGVLEQAVEAVPSSPIDHDKLTALTLTRPTA